MALSWLKLLFFLSIFHDSVRGECKFDLGMILDESSSIGTYFKTEIYFARMFASKLKFGSSHTLASVITVSDHAILKFRFRDYQGYNSNGLQSALYYMHSKGGGSRIEKGLEMAASHMFTDTAGQRHSVAKILFVLTDGRSSSSSSQIQAATSKLKAQGVTVFAIGVGAIKPQTLQYIASESKFIYQNTYATTIQSIIQNVYTASCSLVTCHYKDCYYHTWSQWSVQCGNSYRTKTIQSVVSRSKTQVGGCTGLRTSCEAVVREEKNLGSCADGNVMVGFGKQEYVFKALSEDNYISRQDTVKLISTPVSTNCNLDLGVILDESESVFPLTNFKKETHFIQEITDKLLIGLEHTLVSVMMFSTHAKMQWRFRDYQGYSKTGLTRGLSSLVMTGGFRVVTDKAIETARTKMFTTSAGARYNFPKVLFVISTSNSDGGVTSIKKYSDLLKDHGVNVYVFGVGSDINTSELQAIATDNRNVFRVNSFSSLQSIAAQVKTAICTSFTCNYYECNYQAWSAWTGTCGDISRTRKLASWTQKQKKQVGGCAGLPVTCSGVLKEFKTTVKCPGTVTKMCKLDLGVILDESSSISPTSLFRKETDFIKHLTDYLIIGSDQTLVSVITFSSIARMKFKFRDNDGRSKFALNNALLRINMLGGNTATERALDMARTDMYSSSSGQRQDVAKVLIVITDGNSQAGPVRVKQASDLLTDKGVNVFAVGVGSVLNENELRAIATNDTNIFRVNGLNDLNSIITRVQSASCAAVTCHYKDCSYYHWASWSATCGTVTRSKRLYRALDQTSKRIGGCAGLATTCRSSIIEQKTLTACKPLIVECIYYECNWGDWSHPSSTCGYNVKRQRFLMQKQRSAHFYTSCPSHLNLKSCSKTPQISSSNILCPCKISQCSWLTWSGWSATCGSVTRTRLLRKTYLHQYFFDCKAGETSYGCKISKDRETQSANVKPCIVAACKLDLGVVLDESSSIPYGSFRKETEFIKDLTDYLPIGLTNTLVSIITFSTDPQLRFRFRDYPGYNKYGLNGALDRMNMYGGNTGTEKALEMARQRMFTWSSGSRHEVSKALIVITDGNSQAGPTIVKKASDKLAVLGISIFAVGVGKVNQNELKAIATDDANIFYVNALHDLRSIVNRVRTATCAAKECRYKHCVYYQWSTWSGTCDRVHRSRKLYWGYDKVERRYGGCAGLPTSCHATEQEEQVLKACRPTVVTCTYYLCNWGSWSAFSTTCGNNMKRQRILVETEKTNRYYTKCPLELNTKHCSKTPSIEIKSVYCPCRVDKCAWYGWSQWSATCGSAARTRKLHKYAQHYFEYDCPATQKEKGCKEIEDTETQSSKLAPCSRECEHAVCGYNAWSSWSGTCGYISRSRTVKTTMTKTLVQADSCDGLFTTSCSAYTTQTQRKSVLCTCVGVTCTPESWTSWSSACGAATRSRSFKEESITKSLYSCKGLKQSCPPKDEQKRTTLCQCNYVECVPNSWSVWSAECGEVTRTRTITSVQKSVMRSTCDGLKTVCPKSTETESGKKLCVCKYVECVADGWSSWTSECGKATRSRVLKTIQKTIERYSCHGLRQICPSISEEQSRTKLCECHYVQCKPNVWSEWSTECGKGERTRKINTVKKIVMKENCKGLVTSCPKSDETEKRNIKCQCDYVDCVAGQWSEWSAECGSIKRSRPINVVKRTKMSDSCAGLKQTCPKLKEEEHQEKICECKYVQCVPGKWTEWSAECNHAKRTRSINTVQKTIKKLSCHGLPLTCAKSEETETRVKHCPPGECKYVECVPSAWSEWSTECGQGERSRSVHAVEKTILKYKCEGLRQMCPTNKEVETRDKLCECQQVDCLPQAWSEWSAECGSRERTRSIKTVEKTILLQSCEGLKTSCPKSEEKETGSVLCTCPYVECTPDTWSEWSAECGAAERSRSIRTMEKTIQQLDCKGLRQTCSQPKEIQERNILCECEYVQCVPGSWSKWSAECGKATRTRIINSTPKLEKRESCEGLLLVCPSSEETDTRNTKCQCEYVECVPGIWSEWSSECGKATRNRQINYEQRTVEKYSCEGLMQQCPKSEEVESRNELCECEYVECVPGTWTEWSTECGESERSRSILSVSKTVKKSSCEGLTTSCPKSEEKENRKKLCSCSYVDCETGAWSEWSAKCGKAERRRVTSAVMQEVQKYSCEGLKQTCPVSEEVEERDVLCDCSYVECVAGAWSEWSGDCGEIQRTRPINVIKKTVKKASCDGLTQTCQKSEDSEYKETMCTCTTIECNWAPWSMWTATCGDAVRTRVIVGKLATVQRLSCDDVKKECTENPETQTKQFHCDATPTKPTGTETCHIKYRPLGCYDDDQKVPRPLPELILTDRDPTYPTWTGRMINWKQWNSYHVDFICRCAAKAKEMKYHYFSTQFYGECWSGPEAGDTYARNGKKDYSHCIKSKFDPCSVGDLNCVGKKETNYVYELSG